MFTRCFHCCYALHTSGGVLLHGRRKVGLGSYVAVHRISRIRVMVSKAIPPSRKHCTQRRVPRVLKLSWKVRWRGNHNASLVRCGPVGRCGRRRCFEFLRLGSLGIIGSAVSLRLRYSRLFFLSSGSVAFDGFYLKGQSSSLGHARTPLGSMASCWLATLVLRPLLPLSR